MYAALRVASHLDYRLVFFSYVGNVKLLLVTLPFLDSIKYSIK